MANAKAPLQKEVLSQTLVSIEQQYLDMAFDSSKKYLFELANGNEEREIPAFDMTEKRSISTPKFKPYVNIVLTSQIVWNGQRRMIRYYDGCTSIFADEQPQNKELLDELMKATNHQRLAFVNGKFGIYGDEKQLLLYLLICSWNVESPFRTRTATAVFRPKDSVKAATIESQKLDMQDKAFECAKDAKETKMRIHAAYLGISTVDWESGNDRTELEIRTDYRKYALKDPQEFLESYGNETLEVKYFIQKAWESGLINNLANPNEAQWKSGKVICDISGLQSLDGIVAKLYELSQLPEGEEFLIQIKALNE